MPIYFNYFTIIISTLKHSAILWQTYYENRSINFLVRLLLFLQSWIRLIFNNLLNRIHLMTLSWHYSSTGRLPVCWGYLNGYLDLFVTEMYKGIYKLLKLYQFNKIKVLFISPLTLQTTWSPFRSYYTIVIVKDFWRFVHFFLDIPPLQFCICAPFWDPFSFRFCKILYSSIMW